MANINNTAVYFNIVQYLHTSKFVFLETRVVFVLVWKIVTAAP